MPPITAQEFFSNASHTFREYRITTEQIEALQACIEERVTVAEATKILTTYVSASPTPLELQQRLSGLWTLLNDTAVELMTAQPTIISILQTIRALPPEEEPKGEGEEAMDFDDGYYWREITGWANDWADTYNHHGARWQIEKSKGEERMRRGAVWVSANAYTARLSATGDKPLASYGAALDRAGPTVVRALELENEGTHLSDVEAAAQLFIFASQELFRFSREDCGTSSASILWRRRDGGLWEGKDGLSVDRWEFWKTRWATMARGTASEQGQAAAQDALEAMRHAEV
ncbi:hypothetical protein ACJZ2D_003208 [Fusarium nematophilum]